MIEPRYEISDWAEKLADDLAAARLERAPMVVQAGLLKAATNDKADAWQVLITLSRTVALVLRPTGHAGGPIGNPAAMKIDPAYRLAAQLIGCAAQADGAMVDALARTAISAPADPLAECRTILWAILEVLEHEQPTPQPKDAP